MIALKDIEVNENIFKSYCSSRIKQLLKCNGLEEKCEASNEDIFNIIEEYVDNCYYTTSSSSTLCIMYYCISGKWFKYMNVNVFAFVNISSKES